MFLVSQFFKQKAYTHPTRQKIKPDEACDVPFATAVIPRAGVVFCQKVSGCEFYDKNKSGIEKPAGGDMPLFYEFGQWNKQRGTAVNWEHPKGSSSHQFFIPCPQGQERGKNNFNAPTEGAKADKVFE